MTASVLILALFVEEATDERFLPIIVRRTAEALLAARGRISVAVLDPLAINHGIKRRFNAQEERIVEAARIARGYHALLIHADADDATRDRALNERFLLGFERVKALNEGVCDVLVPVIPICMVEAWMLADPDALRVVVGTKIDAQELGLPLTARDIESDRHPKVTLERAVSSAFADRPRRQRRRRVHVSEIIEPLAQRIRLERLDALSAYSAVQGRSVPGAYRWAIGGVIQRQEKVRMGGFGDRQKPGELRSDIPLRWPLVHGGIPVAERRL